MFLNITNSIFDLVSYSKNIYKNARLFFGYDKPIVTYFIYAFIKELENVSDDEYEKVTNEVEKELIEASDKEKELNKDSKDEQTQSLESKNKNEPNYKLKKKLISVTNDINEVLNLKYKNEYNLVQIEEFIQIGDNDYFFVHKRNKDNKDLNLSFMITQFFKNNYEYILDKIKSNANFILATVTESNKNEFDDNMEDIEPYIYFSQIYPNLFTITLNDLGNNFESIEFLLLDGDVKKFNSDELILF
jgi:hypothetical protein